MRSRILCRRFAAVWKPKNVRRNVGHCPEENMTHRTETLDTVLTGCSGNSSNREWRLCCAVAMRCALTLLVAAALARPAQAASPAAEASARLLAQVEPRIKAIYETDEFRMRSFRRHLAAGRLGLSEVGDARRRVGSGDRPLRFRQRPTHGRGGQRETPRARHLRAAEDPRVRLLADGQAFSAAHGDAGERAGAIAGCMNRSPGICVR